jgi:hypothetical protein
MPLPPDRRASRSAAILYGIVLHAMPHLGFWEGCGTGAKLGRKAHLRKSAR